MSTRHAKQSGADSVLLVAPYYNKPTQEGLYQHFKAINDAVEIPQIIYNIPGRSVVNITDDTLARLSELPNVVGIKDATGDLARVHTLRARQKKPLAFLSGEDMTAVAFNAIGGRGCISVSSNIMPKACAQVQALSLAGDIKGALALHETLVPLHLGIRGVIARTRGRRERHGDIGDAGAQHLRQKYLQRQCRSINVLGLWVKKAMERGWCKSYSHFPMVVRYK